MATALYINLESLIFPYVLFIGLSYMYILDITKDLKWSEEMLCFFA